MQGSLKFGKVLKKIVRAASLEPSGLARTPVNIENGELCNNNPFSPSWMFLGDLATSPTSNRKMVIKHFFNNNDSHIVDIH